MDFTKKKDAFLKAFFSHSQRKKNPKNPFSLIHIILCSERERLSRDHQTTTTRKKKRRSRVALLFWWLLRRRVCVC